MVEGNGSGSIKKELFHNLLYIRKGVVQCYLVTKSSHKGWETTNQICKGLVCGMSNELEHQPDGLEVPFTLIFRIPVKGQGVRRRLHKVDFDGWVRLEWGKLG